MSDAAGGGATAEVATTARLHLGFLDLEGALGRRFGSVGLSLDQPATVLRLAHADTDGAATDRVDGPDGARALAMLGTARAALGIGAAHRLQVRSAMPAHAGLGSGTQLALAVAAALRRLHGLPADTRADARSLGRGRRSGVGIGLFDQGGLVVDGGPGAGGALPPILARLPVPDGWRVILVLDRAGAGLSGAGETAAFAQLPPMPATDPGALCRLVLMQLLPALAEADLPRFGDALTRMQERLGDHFAPAQGGSRFSSRPVGAAVAALGARGATGLGQTSWGPTGFAFVAGDTAARRLADELAACQEFRGLDFQVCRTLNRAASVAMVGPDREGPAFV